MPTFSSVFYKVFNGMSLRDLGVFIMEKEKLASRAEPQREDSPAVRRRRSYVVGSSSGENSQEPGKSISR